MHHFSSLRLRLIGATALLATTAPAQAQDGDTQFWMTGSVSHHLDPATSLSLDLIERYREERLGGDMLLARLSASRAIAPGVEIGLGVMGADSAGGEELRTDQTLTLSHGVFALRSRLEERFSDTSPEMQMRLRERIQVALPLDKSWTMLASGELFFQLNRTRISDVTGLNGNRLALGARRALGEHWALAMTYQRIQLSHADGPKTFTHAPTLAVSYNF